jgi:Flp pilus assembly pilin Flp
VSAVRSFLRDGRGAGAAEFALILPLFLLFLLGIIDAGRYAWAFNQAEKATQIGARWAVVTNSIPSNLRTYNFVSGSIAQGSVVPQSAFAGVQCKTAGASTAPVCECKTSNACGFDATAEDAAAWTTLIDRMNDIYPGLTAANVVIDYDWSGLGYAGDPNGADVAPLVTVSLRDVDFQPMTTMLFGGALGIPSASYTLTMEDGSGTESN